MPICIKNLPTLLILLGSLFFNLPAYSQDMAQFKRPADNFRPKVLWQWMGGLISKEGIKKDLQAMADQGIGGVMIMQMPDQEPYPLTWSFRDYPGKVKVLSDEWFALVNFAIGEADKLGLSVKMFLTPGWNYAGGPWVTVDKSMKQLSISKTILKSGESVVLKKAPTRSIWWTTPEWHKDYSRKPEFIHDYYKDIVVLATPHAEAGKIISQQEIIDISTKMQADGTLKWKAPKGEWDIWRIALVSANALNHPAPIETIGQESDRMDPEAIKLVFDGMIGRINREAKAKGYKSFVGFETDSYESGYQDFSLDFAQEFKKRRGYDCTTWLPAWKDRSLVIGSKLQTERFHYDMKMVISALQSERFYGTLKQLGIENQLEWALQPYFTIDLDWRSISGLAQAGSEFWVKDKPIIDGTAAETSVLYGQNVVWAEAFTAEPYESAWRNDPRTMKPVADYAFSKGINDLYMHGFPLNPFSDKYQPGLMMGYWGTNLGRYVTWWPYSLHWHRYLARCAYMLQQGRPTADALVYPSQIETFPHSIESKYRLTALTDDVLLNGLRVKNGMLSLPSGISVKALILNKGMALSPEALRKIRDLVNDGATLIGFPPPAHSVSLKDFPQSDTEVTALIEEIWGKQQIKGKVFSSGYSDEELSKIIGLPDFIGDSILSAHRKIDGGEIFFVTNQKAKALDVELSFDVADLQPQWWDPVNGTTRNINDYRQQGGRTSIPFKFGEHQSGFVVFKKPETRQTVEIRKNSKEAIPQTLTGAWKVQFDTRWGGPGEVKFDTLSDWSVNPNAGIKYYSGTAIYSKIFDLNKSGDYVLSLGEVKNLAEVSLNGKTLGTLWCAPWQLDIPSEWLKAKNNVLEIKVTNTWVNRLIGDEQEPEDCEWIEVNTTGDRTGGYTLGVVGKGLKDLPLWLINDQPRPSSKRYTFSSWHYYNKEAPLMPAGLLGPVNLKPLKAE